MGVAATDADGSRAQPYREIVQGPRPPRRTAHGTGCPYTGHELRSSRAAVAHATLFMEFLPMHRLRLVAAAALGIATALPAAAQFQKPEDAVKYRKAVFTVMATHFGRLGAMANGRVPFDAVTAPANAEVVVDLSKLPYAGFVDGTSGTEKGSPKANVWTERAKFDAAAKKMQDEVLKLAAASKTEAGLKAAFGPAAAACKACHDDFRNP